MSNEYLDNIYTGFMSGLTGQRMPQTAGQILRGEAAKAGMTVDQFLELQKRLQALAMEKQVAELQQTAAQTAGSEATTRKTNFDIENMTREHADREAMKTALTGRNQTDQPITTFIPQAGGSTQSLLGGVPAQGAPGLYLEEGTRDEQYAEVLRQEQLDKTAQSLYADAAQNERRIEEGNRAERRLAMDRQREARQSQLTQKSMELIDERIRASEESGQERMTYEQAQKIVAETNDIDFDDADANSQYVEEIHQVMELANNRNQRTYDSMVNFLNGRPVNAKPPFLDDQSAAGGNLQEGVGAIDQQLGEQRGPTPPEQKEQPIFRPSEDGVPDPRALDPRIPVHSLVGADPRANHMIQQEEIEADRQRYDAAIRQLQSLGVPFEEWPEELKTVVGIMKDPNKLKALQKR
jgi:hypothetical protein